MYERERGGIKRERDGGRGNSPAVVSWHFCCCFYSFLFFTSRTVYAFWIRYRIDVISCNAYRSVVRMTEVFDLEICSIPKTLLQVLKRENDLMH